MTTPYGLVRNLLAATCLLMTASSALAFWAPAGSELPNYDKRGENAAAPMAVKSTAAVATLSTSLPNAQVDFDEHTGAPNWIHAGSGFLSGPNGQGLGISSATASLIPATEDHRPTKAFLLEYQALFGFGPEILATARVQDDFVTAQSGLRTVVWAQDLDGIPIFESLLISHTTKSNELVNLSSHFLPNPSQAADTGTPRRAELVQKPDISADQAVALAIQDLEPSTNAPAITTADKPSTDADLRQHFTSAPLNGTAEARLTWLPLNQQSLRLCWSVELTSHARGEMYHLLIDAETGEALVRHRLTEYLSDASFRVYTSDSPSPFSPACSTPCTTQPPIVPRTLVTWSALDTNASPAGWINDGDNQTLGNNVDAHTDRNADDVADLPRPQGSPARTFDFTLDLTQAPVTYTNAAVTEIFYWCNWMHDRLYNLGFTEAARNFQTTNFGRGGLGNDPVQADAQDGSGFDNANMSTPVDGSSPRMQMYIFDGPTPDRDGDLDHEVMLHEYTHGLSNRRVGGGVGISATETRGMGEGWSDFYALSLLSEPADDVNGVYACGGYATYQFSGITSNYYFGIRRYPYCTDLTKNPLTFKDTDPNQASLHPGIPRSPVIGTTADEVHNQGEVWCVTLWEARARIVTKYGYAVGNDRILRLVTDGMNLSPANPNFLQARDGILQADVVDFGGVDLGDLWTAFAKRGMGYSATSPVSTITTGVVEAYDVPDNLTVSPAGGFSGSGPVGGPFTQIAQTFTLINVGTNALNWAAAGTTNWLDLSLGSGFLAPGASNQVTISLNNFAYALPAGIYTNTVFFADVTSGVSFGRAVVLRVGQPDYLTELITGADSNILSFQMFTFTPDGSPNFYSACRQAVTNFPTDPTTGTNLALGSDTFLPVTLPATTNILLYGRATNVFYVGSPGYITLLSGDSTVTPTLANHFRLPRIAALSTHLHPPEGGTVTWQQFTNRVTVSFVKMHEYLTANTNTFQIEMYFDGRIRMTFLSLASSNGLVGLSAGNGQPAGFVQSDFTSYGPCTLPMQLNVPATATEGDGVLVGQGSINLPVAVPAVSNLTITLSSSDPTEATVPTNVVILAGQTNATFDITIIDDLLLDGVQPATITASAPGYTTATSLLQVKDNETASLTVALPAAATEGAVGQGTVSASAAPAASIVISLSSSDTTEIQVPSSVLLPAGQTSVVFNFTAVDDTQIDGDRTATVTAHVPNWTDGSTNIIVHDNESTNLVVTLPASAREGDGVLTNAGVVHISGTLSNDLSVTLQSSDLTELLVPPTTTIPAGQTAAAFNLTVVDDLEVDGTQPVTVTATAAGFAAGQTNMVVTDNESPFAPFNPSPAQLATNVVQTTLLTWQSGALPGEVITNDVYFGTNPAPGPGQFQGTTLATNWTLSTLLPQATYYWQIVARKAGVTPGPVWQFTTRGLDHFSWSTISSPQAVNQPFGVTVTAKDAFETTVSNFVGTVGLSATGSGGVSTNVILGNLASTSTGSGQYTLGFGFTPNTNITITHVRSFSGTKVSIWTDTGTLLASQNVNGTPGVWTDTPLTTPLPLTASTAYRVGYYTGGTNTYYMNGSRPATFPNGTLASSYYYTTTDAFPTSSTVSTTVFLCDLRYTVGASGSISMTPSVTGPFTNGAWAGNVTVPIPTTNVVLHAADGGGHTGASAPFAVTLQNDISLTVTDSPDPVSIGGNITYLITVTNIGPATASNVMVTNLLPNAASTVSAATSQGTVFTNANIVIASLGTLGANTAVTVTIVATANSAGVLTNQTLISRSDVDAFPANNFAAVATTVQAPAFLINDVSVVEGNSGTTNALFTVSLSLPPAVITTVNFATTNSLAIAPGDFISTNGTLTFAPGETNKTITVTVIGDTLYEANETFLVNLFSPTNATLADSQGVGTILNDDPMPSLSIGDATVNEGNVGTTNAIFTVNLSAPAGAQVSFFYTTIDGTAINGSDYVARSGTVTLAPGVTTTNISVPINGDLTIEPDEVFYVDLSAQVNATLAKKEGLGTILNDDGLPGNIDHFVWNPISSPQYVSQPFGVTLTAMDAFNNLATTFNGSAFVSASATQPATNVLGTGISSVAFPVYTATFDERTQVIYPASEVGGAGRLNALALNVATLPGLSLTNWTIRLRPTALTNYIANVWESNAWTVVYQTNLSLTTTGWVTFPFSTPFDYDGTNSLMVDLSFKNTTGAGTGYSYATSRTTTRTLYYYDSGSFGDPLTWNGSSPAPFTTTYTPNLLLIRGGQDNIVQPPLVGPFTNGAWVGSLAITTPATNISLRADDGVGHTGFTSLFNTILTDDLSLSVIDLPHPVVVGANLNYLITVQNTGPSAATSVTVTNLLPPTAPLLSVNLSQGTYTSFGSMLVCNFGTLTAGSQATATVTVVPGVAATLTNIAWVAKAESESFTGNNSATNLSSVIVPTITIKNASVVEGNSGTTNLTFSVNLSTQIGLPVSVNFITVDGTAVASLDYTSTNGTLVFIPGQTNQFITVAVVGDTNVEANETFSVVLSNPANGTLGTATGVGTILDDDIGPGQLINFDDILTSTEGAIPPGYRGMTWNNFDYLNAVVYTPAANGYIVGMISSNNVAFNASGSPASIQFTNPVNFVSAYLTPAWNDNLQVLVQGYRSNVLIYSFSNTLSATSPALLNFGFLSVDRVNFTSSGGTPYPPYNTGSGTHFAMDNLLVNFNPGVSTVPPVKFYLPPTAGNPFNLKLGAANGTVLTPDMAARIQIQTLASLSNSAWAPLTNLVVLSNGVLQIQGLGITNDPQRYFRAVVSP